MSTKKRKHRRKPQRRRPAGAGRQLERRAAEAFYEADDAETALELFREAEAKGPLSDQGLSDYLEVLYTVRDLDEYARVTLTMVERHPGNAQANLMAAAASQATGQPVSAILHFERSLQLEPEHPGAEVARESLSKLRSHLPQLLDAFRDDLPKDLPRVASTEKILHFFKLGRFDDVIRRSRQHLQRYPADQRIANNLAEALALRGDHSEALRILNETIERAPSNFFAWAARCCVLYFLNRRQESDADAETLRTLLPRQVSDLTKAAQTSALRGDVDGIAWAFRLAEERDWLKDDSSEVAMLLHYRATQLARAGEVKKAKALWKRAGRIAGRSVPAAENLRDLRQCAGQRSGPFYFELSSWLSATQDNQLSSWMLDVREREDLTADPDDAMREFLQRNPELEHLLPDILDRGDRLAQEFAARAAYVSNHNEARAALVAYVQGARGVDALRHELADRLFRSGALPSNSMTMFIRGKQQQVEFQGFEISDEPSLSADRSDQVHDLLIEALEFLQAGSGAKAEVPLRQALQFEPEAPDILNNLALALLLQGRDDEGNRIADEMIRKHPDYFFGQIAVANRATQRKDFDEAFRILKSLQTRKRLHVTEFVALTQSFVQACCGKNEFSTAQKWLAMLQSYDPDHPAVEKLGRYIRYHRFFPKFLSGAVKKTS